MISDEEHQARLKLYHVDRATDAQIAESRCICVAAVRYWRKCQNPPLSANLEPDELDKLTERNSLLKQGVSIRKIAKLQGVSRGAIRSYIRNHPEICSEEVLM